jgi:two-component system response regulator HydG
VGVSDAIGHIVELVDRVAASDCPVLIEGESGTGKELIARRVHLRSPRTACSFIPVNCAGVGEGIFESQFFGHLKGSFTGARQSMLGLVRAADGGTLFLDEVGEIPGSLQPKLLRVLQEGEVMPVGSNRTFQVDTRFVCATNRSLSEQVSTGNFREDLYYRLNVVRIFLPPLRQRVEDIEPLLDHFLTRFSVKYSRPRVHVSKHVVGQLEEFSWPGNVRQLSTWVERLYATGLEPEVLLGALLGEFRTEPAASRMADQSRIFTLEEAERNAIRTALEHTQNCISEAAKLLRIHRSTLYRKLVQHRIHLEDIRG